MIILLGIKFLFDQVKDDVTTKSKAMHVWSLVTLHCGQPQFILHFPELDK